MESKNVPGPMEGIVRDLWSWLPVGLIPIVDGILRMTMYEPLLGARTAGYVSAGIDIVAIVAYAAWTARTDKPLRRALVWLSASTLLHFALGFAFGLSFAESLAKYDITHGEPWGVISAFIFAAPLIVNGARARACNLRARLVLLVGPKGAGKTTIGRALADGKRIRFVEVEAIAKAVLAKRGNVIDERYARAAFEAILAELRAIEHAFDVLVLETTGASEESPAFLEELRERYRVMLVRVEASEGECGERLSSRDSLPPVVVTGELVKEMHRRTLALSWPWDLVIDNDGREAPAALAERIRSRLA